MSNAKQSSNTNSPSLKRELALAIIPSFVSVFIFAGMLETYKNDMSYRKDLVIDFYRPMRGAQAECRTLQNQLFLKHFDQAGTFTLMENELDHIVSNDPNTLSPDYEALPRSIIESNNKLGKEAKELKEKVDTCTTALFQKYEEVALATGTYDQFREIEDRRIVAVNALQAKQTEIANVAAKKGEFASLVDTMRGFLGADLDAPGTRQAFALKFHEIATPTIELYTKLAENEQDIYKIDLEADTQLISLFATEVNRRYKRGLFSALWQW
jgi:hypothetical protein